MKLRLNVGALKAVVCLTAVLALFLGGMLVLRTWEEGETFETAGNTESTDPWGTEETEERVRYNGAWYVPRDDLEVTLLLGIDNNAGEGDWIEGRVFTQSDFMMLLIMDKTTGACSAIPLNRNTIAEYRIITNAGREMGTEVGQLTLAHSYGGTEKMRCENTVDAVSRLLYGVEIDHYVSLMMDGVAVLNDIAGGVTLEVMDDFGSIDPTLKQGETVTLMGQQALTYIRSRMGMEDSTNVHRMERQKQYLEALQDQFLGRTDVDEEFILRTVMELNPYMTSDCTVEQLSALAQTLQEDGVSRYLDVEGETVQGEDHAEFRVDEASLQALVMEEFYRLVEE